MTARPASKLPQDSDYWERLEREIRDDAAAPLAAYAAASGHGRGRWLDMLTRRATWWVAAAAATSTILWLSLPPRGPSPALVWIEAALAPDGVAGTLVSGDTPPAVDTVMVHFPPAAGEEQRR